MSRYDHKIETLDLWNKEIQRKKDEKLKTTDQSKE